MNRKQPAAKRLRDRCLYAAARFYYRLPTPAATALFSGLAGAAFLCSRRLAQQRALVNRNIARCLPALPPRERRRLTGALARRLATDFHHSVRIGRRAWVQAAVVRTSGLDHLDRALADGRGVLCLAAHFGNFPLMLAWLTQAGYPVSTIIRDYRNPYLGAYWRRAQARAGLRAIPKHPPALALRRALRWLRGGNILFILADQHADRGVNTFFFGQPAVTAPGPAALSRRTGCPVVPVSIRATRAGYEIRAEAPLELPPAGEAAGEDIAARTARFNRVIEAWVREAPDHWSSWLNKRFAPGGGEKRGGR